MPIHQNQTSKEDARLVSFIIPVHNVPPGMLCECLDSILALSLREYEREIIVVDDGSDTSPLTWLADYLDQIVYVRQRNGGLGQARNRGLANACGTYIQFIDGDDALIAPMYEHCLDMVRFQQPDMVMYDFSRKKSGAKEYNDLPAISGKELMRHHNIKATACCYLFRAALLGTLRFTPGIYHEDEEFTPLLLLRAETIVQTDAAAYYYRPRQASITTDKDVRRTLKRLGDLKSIIFRLYALADIMPGSERLALLRRVHQLTMDYIYKVIVGTRSMHYLNRQLDSLSRQGLFPLPDRDYTSKYKWFRRLTNSKIGLAFLMRTLPLIKSER